MSTVMAFQAAAFGAPSEVAAGLPFAVRLAGTVLIGLAMTFTALGLIGIYLVSQADFGRIDQRSDVASGSRAIFQNVSP